MKIHPSAYDILMSFGKYKGKSLGYILEFDRYYLNWLANTVGIPKMWQDAAILALQGEAIINSKLPTRPLPNLTDSAHLFVVDNDKGIVGCTFKRNDELKIRFKSIADGARWNDVEFRWEFSYVHLHSVLRLFKSTVGIIADETVKQWFKDILQHKQKLELIRTKTDSDICIPNLLRPLYGYQKVNIEFGLAAGGRWINADSMGLGKSACALGFTLVVGGKALIVCPKSVKIQWTESILTFTGKESCVWGPKGAVGNEESDFHIINYDNVSKFVSKLNAIGFNTLICDEATHLKNYKSMRTKAIFGSWKERSKFPGIQAKYVNLLTGTPLLNRPVELFTLLSGLDHKRFNNPIAFLERYGGSGSKSEPQNLLELHDRAKELMIRHTKAQVANELKKGRHDILIELSKSDKKIYNKAVTDVFNKWKLSGKPSAAHMPKLRNILFEYKFPRIIEFAEEMIESGRPILIFTIQQLHAERIAAHFGNTARLITGKVQNDSLRRQHIQDVIDGKAMVMVMTIKAGGMGIDGLQHAICDTLFCDRWFVPADHEQAEDRTNRLGQKNPTQMWYLTVRDTFDEEMAKILLEKQVMIDEAIEGKRNEDGRVDEIRHKSIFTELVKRMAANKNEFFDFNCHDIPLSD